MKINSTDVFKSVDKGGLAIIDIDGTLCDASGRLERLGIRLNGRGRLSDQDYDDAYVDEQFYREIEDDPKLDNGLCEAVGKFVDEGGKVVFFTARRDQAYEATTRWLKDKIPTKQQFAIQLYMRPVGDSRPASQVKEQLYKSFADENQTPTVLSLDDNGDCLDMWRRVLPTGAEVIDAKNIVKV